MDKDILKIVNKVLSEEVSGKLSKIKTRIFENKSMCSECGSTNVMENECMECGTMYEGDIQELGGMEDGHPKFGDRRLPKRMSPEDIEKLLRGDDKEEDKSFDDDDYPTKPGFVKKRTKQMSHHPNRKHNNGEVGEGRYVTSKGGRFDREKIPMSRQDMEIGMDNMPGFDLEEFCSHHHNMDKDICRSHYDHNGGELGERLYGNQKRIDKNKNGRIDGEDFKMLRKESVYEITLDNNEKFRFNESEIVDVIENIILEEKKKSKSKPKSKDPIKLTKANQEKSKKENDDNINDVVKKMKDYLKDGSKGKYEMNPKHFPKGNGELEKMEKMAYIPSNAVQDYTDNFTAAALENLDFSDGIKPDEDFMNDLMVGSSRTGNNPDWANAVETPVNKKRNQIRKDNLLAKVKRQAYNKAPQPVNDVAGNKTDKASKIMLNLESTENKKVITDIDKIKNLMGYIKNTQ
jgi:hypothetical protein